MPEKEVLKPVNMAAVGLPLSMSVNPIDDELIVVVEKTGRCLYLNKYRIRCANVAPIKSIRLPARMDHGLHAVSLRNGNLIICYHDKNEKCQGSSSYLTEEWSADARKVIRKYDEQSITVTVVPRSVKRWIHLAVDEDDYIFSTIHRDDKVTRLCPPHIEPKKKFLICGPGPKKLCYVKEKQMLIVANYVSKTPSFSVFYLHPSKV